jgi:hypothetical protein
MADATSENDVSFERIMAPALYTRHWVRYSRGVWPKTVLNFRAIISKQIDYLGGMPSVQPKPVRTSEKAKEMLQFDLENEMATIRRYRERVRQCEGLGEYAMAEHIREILKDEQDHLISLASALGEAVPAVKSASAAHGGE